MPGIVRQIKLNEMTEERNNDFHNVELLPVDIGAL
jgi:hypothetical protein